MVALHVVFALMLVQLPPIFTAIVGVPVAIELDENVPLTTNALDVDVYVKLLLLTAGLETLRKATRETRDRRAIVGGTAGSVIAQGPNFGLSTYFMKFSREYESQVDINRAQLMARAGYDPHDMANMFKTLDAQGGGNGPERLASHRRSFR